MDKKGVSQASSTVSNHCHPCLHYGLSKAIVYVDEKTTVETNKQKPQKGQDGKSYKKKKNCLF